MVFSHQGHIQLCFTIAKQNEYSGTYRTKQSRCPGKLQQLIQVPLERLGNIHLKCTAFPFVFLKSHCIHSYSSVCSKFFVSNVSYVLLIAWKALIAVHYSQNQIRIYIYYQSMVSLFNLCQDK